MARKTNNYNIGQSEGEFTAKVTAIHDKVVLEKCEIYHERVLPDTGLVVPIKGDINFRANKGKVISIGKEAMSELNGLSVGDYVLYDHLAAFYDTHPIVVVKADNIIAKVNS